MAVGPICFRHSWSGLRGKWPAGDQFQRRVGVRVRALPCEPSASLCSSMLLRPFSPGLLAQRSTHLIACPCPPLCCTCGPLCASRAPALHQPRPTYRALSATATPLAETSAPSRPLHRPLPTACTLIHTTYTLHTHYVRLSAHHSTPHHTPSTCPPPSSPSSRPPWPSAVSPALSTACRAGPRFAQTPRSSGMSQIGLCPLTV